jgi:hypothetical protein
MKRYQRLVIVFFLCCTLLPLLLEIHFFRLHQKMKQHIDAQIMDIPPLRRKRNPSDSLPLWIRNYLSWHQKMRTRFPGKLLFEDPKAPKLLVRTCLGVCGGLHDRLGQLPWDLYLANQTGRVLLIHWHRPTPLEHFLLPNELDWRVPNEPTMAGWFPTNNETVVPRKGLHTVRSIPELFAGYSSDRPTDEFWNKSL